MRWGSWLKAGLGTGLVVLMAQSQNGIGNGSTTDSRLSSSSALSTLLRRRAVGRGSRSHEGSRERPTSRGELPLDVESAQSAFRRSERHHHDRRQPRKENEDGGLERKTLPLDCESSGERKNALNPNQPIALSQEFGPFYWLQPPPHLRPRRMPESPDSLPVSDHVIPCMEYKSYSVEMKTMIVLCQMSSLHILPTSTTVLSTCSCTTWRVLGLYPF